MNIFKYDIWERKVWTVVALLFFLCAAYGCGSKTADLTVEEAIETFPGSWEAEDGENVISLDIWTGEDNIFYGEISCGKDENTVDFWEFDATYEDGKLIYDDCIKTTVTYNDDGYSGEEEVYTQGKGTITISGDKLIWKDMTENLKYTFEYVGSY